jgi:ribosomal protein L35AE/L33A
MRELRVPKPEKLRVLMLGSSSEGDLRVGREQARIRNAVQTALHRDLVEMDVRTSATTRDLLQGITGFRPHVVHFSGHSGVDLLEFEDDLDGHHQGMKVSAKAFMAAITATDDPPLLVLFNSCDSASQAEKLVGEEIPFAIGMTAAIGDADAINYAAQFYAAVADGQSIRASHLSGQAALQLAGLPGADLPTLFHAPDVDAKTCLVTPPAE